MRGRERGVCVYLICELHFGATMIGLRDKRCQRNGLSIKMQQMVHINFNEENLRLLVFNHPTHITVYCNTIDYTLSHIVAHTVEVGR